MSEQASKMLQDTKAYTMTLDKGTFTLYAFHNFKGSIPNSLNWNFLIQRKYQVRQDVNLQLLLLKITYIFLLINNLKKVKSVKRFLRIENVEKISNNVLEENSQES